LIIDSHAHLDDGAFSNEIDMVMARARAAGVGAVINPGGDVASSKAAVAIAAAYPEVYALAGIHPHEAAGVADEEIGEIARILSAPKVVGIGEIGLDYYRDLCPRDDQLRVFRAQMDLARQIGLPVQIHNRDAHSDTLKVVREYSHHIPAIVMHCYSGSAEMARELAKLGCYISLAGPVTYRNARKQVEVAGQVPLDRLLVETDSPYLPPSPYRGQRNEPAYVVETARKIAEIRNTSFEEVAAATSANAARIFGISPGWAI
jgi:TatD DNase family protein